MPGRVTFLAKLTAVFLMGAIKAANADSADEYLTAQMTARHIPGLSAAVVQDGKVIKAQGYGFSNAKAKTPASAETVYQIGSLTKQFTAAAILRLQEQGKLGVDDRIEQYIDGVPQSWKAITIRELLNHTSGIRNYREGLTLKSVSEDYTAAQVIRLADQKPLLFVPGTQFSYSNTNYHLLGMIAEKSSGMSYGDYLQQTFFGPLGMTQTRMARPGSSFQDQAVGTVWNGKTVRSNSVVFSPTINFGDGGILSTVTDLVKWNAALDNDSLLNPASKRLLWTPPTLAGGSVSEYAAGWFNSSVKTHSLLWHNGATVAGFTGAIFKFPADKLTVIVLTNSLDIPGVQTSIPLYGLTLGLAALYLPDLAKGDIGIADPAPQTAELVKTVAAQLAAGKLDKSLFSSSFQTLLTPATLDSLHNSLASLGPLTSLTLLSRTPDGIARYKALYGTTAVSYSIAVDKDGKISSLLIQNRN